MTRWVEPRAQVTATGVLRPAAARQAFDDLGLVAWTRERHRHDYSLISSRVQTKEMEAVLDTLASTHTWRSARDCPALDRLWNAALTCRVIRIEGRWGYPSWPGQLDDEGIVNLAVGAGLDLLFGYLDHNPGFGISVLGYALLRSYVRGPRPIPLDEIEEFALSWMFPPRELAGVGPAGLSPLHPYEPAPRAVLLRRSRDLLPDQGRHRVDRLGRCLRLRLAQGGVGRTRR